MIDQTALDRPDLAMVLFAIVDTCNKTKDLAIGLQAFATQQAVISLRSVGLLPFLVGIRIALGKLTC
jgi:hypothetical protein